MKNDAIVYRYTVPGDDFTRAGEASGNIKGVLKKLGAAPEVVRKVAISMYEGEINMVIHAGGGEITVTIDPEWVEMELRDHGPGIADVNKAMEEGFSTASAQVRNLGFGAGMGLPNMRKYSDEMKIESTVGEGTTVTMRVKL